MWILPVGLLYNDNNVEVCRFLYDFLLLRTSYYFAQCSQMLTFAQRAFNLTIEVKRRLKLCLILMWYKKILVRAFAIKLHFYIATLSVMTFCSLVNFNRFWCTFSLKSHIIPVFLLPMILRPKSYYQHKLFLAWWKFRKQLPTNCYQRSFRLVDL